MRLIGRNREEHNVARMVSVVLFAYGAIQLIYLLFFEPYPGVDWSRFHIHSDYLLNGEYTQRTLINLLYNLLVAFFKVTGLGIKSLFFFQAVVSWICLWSLCRYVGAKISDRTSLLIAVLFCCSYPIWKWNSSLMTESLFISLGMLLVVMVGKFSDRPDRKNLLKALLIGLCMAFLRQNGWVFLVLTTGFMVYRSFPLYAIFNMCVLMGVIGMFVLFNSNLFRSLELNALGNFEKGLVIYGWDNWSISNQGKLFFTRIFVELCGMRPYYSLFHNVVASLIYVPFVLVVFGGMLRKVYFRTIHHPVFLYCTLIIFGQYLLVGISFADWEGRFTYQVFPFLMVVFALVLTKRGRELEY